MATPEEIARQKIDVQLTQAGWVIQDRSDFDRTAAFGVAVREFLMDDGTEADYLLFSDGKAIGVIEAKPAGFTLSGVESQSKGYSCQLPEYVKNWMMPLPFIYESTGDETFFCDARDETARSRRVFSFHKPETLLGLVKDSDTLRNRLKYFPALDETGLRDCQVEAINGLEESFYHNQPKSLIQMATGAGKTYTSCNFVYRLLKYGKAKRILFLVDRNNLGRQARKEFENFKPRDENRAFTDIYIAQHLSHFLFQYFPYHP
ncbi:MAG: DEAD/DEAH box helicase family protein [Alphaproteobacteria bacterium]|nr:DEAD/DEAH box helicase family protein [Alphaproteobacteria bacterium]